MARDGQGYPRRRRDMMMMMTVCIIHLPLAQFVQKSWSRYPSFYGLLAVLNIACYSYNCCHYWKCFTKHGILGMTLNCFWWWESNPGAFRNVMYLFTAITAWSTLSWNSSTCWGFIYGQIELFHHLPRIIIIIITNGYLKLYICKQVFCAWDGNTW